MSEKLIPTWGYHNKGGPKLFQLKEGEGLPKGYRDTPYPPKGAAVAEEPEAEEVIEEVTEPVTEVDDD